MRSYGRPRGLPLVWSGNLADVYRIECPATGNTWALKCFTREVAGRQDRYRVIAEYLERGPAAVHRRLPVPGTRDPGSGAVVPGAEDAVGRRIDAQPVRGTVPRQPPDAPPIA